MEQKAAWTWVGGLLLGTAGMYFLDPRSGRRRRARARDWLFHSARVAEHSVDRLVHDATNRAQGTVARTRRLLTPQEQISNQRLEARVRSTLGRLTSQPGKIQVEADESVVTLSGTVPQAEVGEVLAGVRRVQGVKRVISRLNATETVVQPATAAEGRVRTGMPPDLLQSQMSPTSRAILGAAGAVVALAGLQRGDARGLAAAALGGLMFARALSNVSPAQAVGKASYPVTVQRSAMIQAPISEVFAFWSNFTNFPRFMQNLREVSESESGISHWVAEGPLGIPVSWDAEITTLQAHKRISWSSIEGSTVRNAGEVRFEEVEPDRTRIHVHMTYHPPGGALGQAVARVFGANPEQQLEEDLRQLKRLLERPSATSSEATLPSIQPGEAGA